MKIVCVSSVGTATAVGVINNFRKYDSSIYIVGLDINDYGYTAGSQLVDKYYQVPYANDDTYIEVVRDILIDENVDLFIPINDVEIEAVANNRSIFDDGCQMLIPLEQTMSLVQHKYKMNKKASELGLSVPKMDEFDVNVKCIVRDFKGVGSKGIHFYDSISEAKVDSTKQFAQECVMGEEYTVDVLSTREGCPIFIIPRKRLEVKSGVATKVEILNDQKMIKDVKTLIEYLKIPGFANVQFIKDAAGNNWFIEVNSRIGGCSNSSLMAAPDMFKCFVDIANRNEKHIDLNQSVIKWDSIVTRYYEDILYEK